MEVPLSQYQPLRGRHRAHHGACGDNKLMHSFCVRRSLIRRSPASLRSPDSGMEGLFAGTALIRPHDSSSSTMESDICARALRPSRWKRSHASYPTMWCCCIVWTRWATSSGAGSSKSNLSAHKIRRIIQIHHRQLFTGETHLHHGRRRPTGSKLGHRHGSCIKALTIEFHRHCCSCCRLSHDERGHC